MKKYLAYIVGIIALIALPTFFVSSTSASENIDTTVNVEPSLTLSVSANTLNLNLDPSSTTFGYNDLDVTVGTNNATGYKLTMSTTSGNTNLVNTEDNTKVIETLPTLSGGYTDSTFIANKWGYKKNRNTDNYNSFPATQTLLENSTRTNEDVANLRFATKIDYLQESGTYTTVISFNAVANPLLDYIQDLTTTICQEKASSANYTVLDKRDGQEYTVRYINGNCWMTKNIAIGCNGSGSNYGDTITPIQLTSSDTNISATTWTTPADSLTLGGTYDNPRMECSSTYGAWYNYVAITAGTITGSSNNTDATYDICPKGWRLPTYSEQTTVLGYPSEFAVTKDGYWTNGSLNWSGTTGFWLSSTAATSFTNRRWGLLYNWDSPGYVGNLKTYPIDNRSNGFAIRCIAE